MQEIHKDDGANACWIGFKQTAEKGRNWTNKRETRAALSARWHLPSTITLTLAEAFAESTSSNDLLKVQAANALPGFLASPRQSETFLKKFTARHTIAAGTSNLFYHENVIKSQLTLRPVISCRALNFIYEHNMQNMWKYVLLSNTCMRNGV